LSRLFQNGWVPIFWVKIRSKYLDWLSILYIQVSDSSSSTKINIEPGAYLQSAFILTFKYFSLVKIFVKRKRSSIVKQFIYSNNFYFIEVIGLSLRVKVSTSEIIKGEDQLYYFLKMT